jgi:hypothetical protein
MEQLKFANVTLIKELEKRVESNIANERKIFALRRRMNEILKMNSHELITVRSIN